MPNREDVRGREDFCVSSLFHEIGTRRREKNVTECFPWLMAVVGSRDRGFEIVCRTGKKVFVAEGNFCISILFRETGAR